MRRRGGDGLGPGRVERWAHVRWRLARVVRPAVEVTAPPPGIVVERDVEVIVRDGTVLRANVHRPEGPGRHPVVLCAHPYGKDRLPKLRRRGGWAPPRQHRLLPQSSVVRHSCLTSWEAPDPAYWVPRGYVVVNCDLRGWGRSDGVGELLSAQEGLDLHDVVEWAAAQPWSNGRVGANGVSYLGLSQWRMAEARPPHLRAICVWEGFSDAYADFARPGGVREDGFSILWTRLQQLQRRSPVDLRRQVRRRPERDEWWASRAPELERIDVPALVCASFSDPLLHTRGSFEGHRRLGSAERWLHTHRGPKWATYYGDDALAAQLAFFERHLRGVPDPATPPPTGTVRVEVRAARDVVASVRHEDAWPPPGTRWQPLHLDARDLRLHEQPPDRPGRVEVALRGPGATFRWSVPEAAELVGPMWLGLAAEVVGPDDANLFATVHLVVDGTEVPFEGSYGWTGAPLSCGFRRLAHRDGPVPGVEPWLPAVDHERAVPLAPGEVVAATVELRPSATAIPAGAEVVVRVVGRWPYARNPITGGFPAGYQPSRRGRLRLHTGPGVASALHVPVRP